MASYIEHYKAKFGEGITLHTWTDVQGRKEQNFYITGAAGAGVAPWFRNMLLTRQLDDIEVFPLNPAELSA